jgi:hypothetical protein
MQPLLSAVTLWLETDTGDSPFEAIDTKGAKSWGVFLPPAGAPARFAQRVRDPRHDEGAGHGAGHHPLAVPSTHPSIPISGWCRSR